MRNNIKKLLILIIFFIALFIPNAYAANGFSVEGISVDSKSGTIDVVDPVLSSDEVVSDIKFNQKDDYVTFNVTIKNNESEAYAINSITDNNSNDKFVITYNYSTDYIQPNETTNIKITFTYKETEKNVDKVDINDLVIKLSLVSEEGEIKGDDIIINPTTNDKILKYIMWLVIAFVGIVLSLYFVKDKKIKSGLIILCLSLVLVPIASYATEEITLKLKFTSIELVGEYEDYEIQIKDKDGNVIETRTITYGQKLGALTHDDITGYVFDKYVDQNGNEVTEDTIITGPISVLLKYTASTYQVSFNKNNEYAEGSMSNQTFTYDVEQALTNNAFTYTGYHFVEWNTNTAGTGDSYTDGQAIKNLLTEGSVELFAIWTENTDTPYVVYHYQQQINGSYLESDKDELTGTTGVVITPSVKNYEGFTAPSTTTTTISRFGNTEITYEYTRNQYNLTIVHPEYVETDKSGTYYYEEQVTLNAINRAGYTFDGWSNGATTQEITVTIGTSNVSVEPLYTANNDTTYYVDHKYETLNGDYVTETAAETGTTDTTVSAPVIPRTGFKTPSLQQVTINGNGQSRVEYVYDREEYTFEVTDRTYLTSASTANGTYKYGYTISLEAQERPGYTFTWSDEVTTYEREFELTKNIELSLVYIPNIYTIVFDANTGKGEMENQDMSYDELEELTPNTFTKVGYLFDGWNTKEDGTGTACGDKEKVEKLAEQGTITLYAQWKANPNTKYQVIHQKQKITLDGYEEEEKENLTGTTNESVTPSVKTYEGFISPNTQTVVISGDESTIVTYNYDRELYTVTFNTDGGTDIVDQTIIYGNKITKPTDPTKDGYTFDNWYTDNTYQTVFDFNTIITSNTTIYAKFDELKTCADNENITRLSENTCSNNENITVGDGIVCKRAVKLHEETCSQTDETYYCSGAGYSNGSTMTYGSCGTSGTLSSGDAFTCDVNGDGDFDELTERFYYVSDYYDTSAKGFDTSTAVLIYYNNVTSGISCNKNTFAYDSSNENWHGPRTLIPQLPTTSQWSNISLKSDTRAILAEYQSTHDSPTTTGGGTLPTDFSYEGYAARLLTAKELMSGCNLTEVGIKTTGELDSCNYIMENTRYAKSTIGNTGTWLETPYAFNSDTGWYVGGYYRSVRNSSISNASFGGARPVIEVPKSKIEYGASSVYTVTLNANGGSVNPTSITVNNGDSVGTLPTPTPPANKTFEGWYTNLTDGIKIETPYTPTGDITLIAKWADYLCVKATSLDGATCGHTDGSKGCRKAYSQGTPYEYGNIIDSDTLESGDAFDCNVDGTGYNQRFYYLRTIDDKVALISYTNYEGETGQGNTQSYVYATALTKLPTTTQWSNLPITFEVAEDNTRAARLMTYTDLKYACGNGTTVTNADLLNCQYIFENSGFESTTTGRNGTWLAEENGTYRRIHNSNVAFETKTASSENTVKPVIEVPLKYINDQYIVKFDANGGTLTGDEYVRVNKGSSLGTLPQTSNGNYIFDGWYTSLNYDTEVDSSTVPNGYNTYYAKWTKSVDDAELNKDNFIIELGSSDRIIINNSDEIEDHEFVSNDDTIASVDPDGVIMALSEGNTTISINGLNTQVTISVTVTVIPVSTEYTVSFDPVGGSAVDDMHVTKDTALGSLPEEPIKAGFTFGGWYTYTDYATKVTVDTIIDGNVTFYAKWIPEGKVAEINNTFYDSIQEAANAATSSKTTIIVLQDVSQNGIILDLFSKNTDKNIVLDLDGHTITCTGTQAIKTKATLEITNGTVIDTSSNGTIDLGAGGHLIMNDGRVENSGSRAAIYNDGGTVEIGGTTYLTSNAYYEATKHRGTVQNVSGTTIITGGTIINTRSANSYAVSGNGGTLIIGNENGVYDIDTILMQGETSGIYSDVNYSMFDGTAKGKTSGVHDTAKITEIEDGAVPVTDTDGDYTLYYYEINNPYYVINLEPNGGTVSPNTLHVDKGQEIGNQLPTPTRGVYTFDGWYTNLTDGILVDEHTIPQGNETYVAKWHYEASTEIDNFNMTNDVMTAYYNSIGTWKNDQSTFQANMDANFNYYGCKCNENTCSTSGTNLCDKPNGYDTGFTGQINVYDSSEANKEKGNPVTYTTSDNGVIYNMIPGQTYYWELDSDPQVHGLVKAEGNRRTLNINGVRNARDLGGLKVDTDGDGTVDGTLKYGIIFRGERLYSDTNNVTQLAKLGINEEIDLRKSSEIPTTEAQFPTDQFKHREIKHYQIDYQTQYDNYKLSRDLVIEVMEDIIAGKKVYFHCRIGTDRTGTLAYILEGLLGVTEEDMLEDYELSYFFGLVNRHRYYATDPNSSVSKDQKFVYMYNSINDDGGVYSWFVQDCQTQQERQDLDDLIQAFRDYMIE